MRQSLLFTKTRREDPSDEVSLNAKLLIRAGFIHKNLAGVYSYLPLGLRVIEKIKTIIRTEMNQMGGQEVELSALQNSDLWEKTNRWSDAEIDVWFKTKLHNQVELGLGLTHEEPLADLMTNHILSYRDLPKMVYQFQTKFRNELRAKSGIMRGREFLMKDLYSFHADEADFERFFGLMALAYERVFAQVGLADLTFKTFASGGSFSKYSFEYQTISPAGEDTIFVSADKKIAINEEVYTDEVLTDLGLNRNDLKEVKAIEVGNIFKLGTRFSEALNLNYLDASGKTKPVFMGSYGIGISRLMGTVVEALADDGGLVWPATLSPFAIHLVLLGDKPEVIKEAENLYKELLKLGVEVLFDDRPISAGEKLADADLFGLTRRVIVSDKTNQAGKLEIKYRASGEIIHLTSADFINSFK